MKKIITTVIAAFLIGNMFAGDVILKASAMEALSPNEKHSPFIDSYSVNKEYIQKGDHFDIMLNVTDENIKKDIELQNEYVKMDYDSAFSCENTESAFKSDYIEYDKDMCGGQITFELKDVVYDEEGHKFIITYGFDLNGERYENTITFYLEETDHEVPKTEDEIKGYDLIEEDKQRGTTPKVDIKECHKKNNPRANRTIVLFGADERVKDAQRWLNARYGGKHGYTIIPEDGVPGTRVASAFVKGLQIDLGIAEPTGIFGNATKAAFDRQIGTLNYGSTDSGDKQYVTMLQHAMFCKGYNPGSVSGNFKDNTSSGIINMKHDAGFADANDSQVDSMWFKALLSSDAYKSVNGGSIKIREAQQYLNRNYYRYFGIGPCDGHYSRDTNKAIIYAWQAEEGLDTNTANGNFGPTTKEKCPNLPNDSRYSGQTLKNFTRILQYALYFNGVELSENTGFNGEYNANTKKCVQNFQKFMCLPNTNGNADVGTIMSLMLSKGDTSRAAKGCDCSTKLDASKVSTLYNAGYRYVGRYLTNVPGGRDKMMTINEFRTISEGGMRVFPIFQQGNEYKDHFSEAQGEIDAKLAVEAAKNIYIGQNATIYFAVDYDFMDYEVKERVIPYFLGVNSVMHEIYKDEYKIGVYGSRNICTRVSNQGFATSSFVSDMSTGYSGNYGYPMPTNWAFDQYYEYTPFGFGLDKVAVSGRDNGVALNTKYSGYNRQAAREYAHMWWKSSNDKEYHYYKNADCANFVSQCLVAGGVSMNDAWYSKKIDDKFDVGEPWRLAKKQYKYFKNDVCGYKNGEIIKITTKEEVPSVLARCAAEGNPIQMGDLMYFAHKGQGDEGVHHATIISYVDSGCIKYAAHTVSQFDENLINGIHLDNDDVFIIRMHNSN